MLDHIEAAVCAGPLAQALLSVLCGGWPPGAARVDIQQYADRQGGEASHICTREVCGKGGFKIKQLYLRPSTSRGPVSDQSAIHGSQPNTEHGVR